MSLNWSGETRRKCRTLASEWNVYDVEVDIVDNEEAGECSRGKGWVKTECVGRGHNDHHYFV